MRFAHAAHSGDVIGVEPQLGVDLITIEDQRHTMTLFVQDVEQLTDLIELLQHSGQILGWPIAVCSGRTSAKPASDNRMAIWNFFNLHPCHSQTECAVATGLHRKTIHSHVAAIRAGWRPAGSSNGART